MLLFSMIAFALLATTTTTTTTKASETYNLDSEINYSDNLDPSQAENSIQNSLSSRQNSPPNHHHQVIANDLQEQPEVVDAPDSGSINRRRYQQHNQQRNTLAAAAAAPRERQYQQHHHHQKLLSQASVINGNHATYAEPPADFKPIIYDFDDISRQRLQSAASSTSENSDGSMLNQLPADPNQQQHLSRPSQQAAPIQDPLPMISYTSSSSSSQGQTDQQQPSASMSHQVEHQVAQLLPSGSSAVSGQSDLELTPAASALKPSVGRWSDWHDMSIEPDLASSDSLAANPQYQPAPATYYTGAVGHQTQQPMAQPQALLLPYKTRYELPVSQLQQQQQLAGTKSPVAWFGQNKQPEGMMELISFGGQQQEEEGQQQYAPLRGKQVVEQVNFMPQIVSAATGNGVQPQQQQQYQKRFMQLSSQVKRPPTAAVVATDLQIKGSPQQPSSFQQHLTTNSGVVATHTLGAVKGKLPLNLISQNNDLSELQQNEATKSSLNNHNNHNQLHNQEYAWNMAAIKSGQQQQKKPSDWEQQVPMPTKTLQLKPPAAPSAQRRLKRRRKSKSSAEVRILQLVAASQQQQLQQQQQELSAANLKQVNGFTTLHHPHHHQAAAQQQRQQPLKQVDHTNPQHMEQQLAERVQPVQAAVAAAGAKQQPTKFVKRLGTTTPTSTVTKRQVKRRPIRTLLPVGLSSWFLGGMRALDGKHWQLPSDVISRLAVNDVDFQNHQAPKVAPPSAGSVVLIGASSGSDTVASTPAEQATTTTPATPTNAQTQAQAQAQQVNRVPISQLVPR